MKRAIHSSIEQTVERGHLWHALTPQMFPTQQLADAIDAGLAQSVVLTDDASAMELAGFKPLLVTGRADNIKVTPTRRSGTGGIYSAATGVGMIRIGHGFDVHRFGGEGLVFLVGQCAP